MKTKRKKIIAAVIYLISVAGTLGFSIALAIDAYNYDINNNVDALRGFGAGIMIMIGGSLALYETDLFCTVYYFLFKPKTKAKSVLNLLSTLSLTLVIAYVALIEICMNLRKYENLKLVQVLLLAYAVFRICCIAVGLFESRKEK